MLSLLDPILFIVSLVGTSRELLSMGLISSLLALLPAICVTFILLLVSSSSSGASNSILDCLSSFAPDYAGTVLSSVVLWRSGL